MTSPRVWAALFAALLAGCASDRPVARVRADDKNYASCGIRKPRLWASYALPSELMIEGKRLGGLSGIDYDRRDGSFLAVSDDRGRNGGGRLFRLSIEFHPDRTLSVGVTSAHTLRISDGRAFAHEGEPGQGVDAEAVRIRDDGRIFWTSEGDAAKAQGPALFEQVALDAPSRAIVLPASLGRHSAGTRGPRDNRSFEALDVDETTNALWLGLEAPLIEDGRVPTTKAGADTLILKLSRPPVIDTSFRYQLEPIARQQPNKLADNGLSELLALPRSRFLTLERSGSQQDDGRFRYVSRIFCAAPATATSPAVLPPKLTKRHLAELNALGPFDTANFEGMTFGPILPDGRRSLVLVSDNDFRPERPTLILVLAI